MRLDGKSVVITGAGSGLGRESSLLFAAEGAAVVVADVVPRRAEAVAREVADQGGRAVAVPTDVRSAADNEVMVRAAVEQFGRLDVLFANAGVAPEGFGAVPFDEMTEQQWDDVNDVVLKGVFLSCQAAVRQFRRQGPGGTIVVTGSSGGLVAYPGFYAYCAGKAGVHHLVKSMAVELGKYGIRANALAPAHGMSANFALPPDAEVLGISFEEKAAAEAGGWDPTISPLPLKIDRPPRLLDNARLALFLASDESAYMSGVVIPATDGGVLSRSPMRLEEGWQGPLTT